MRRVAFVGCSKAKQGRTAIAEQLYSPSALFCSARRYARKCNTWFILSAKYGVVRPSQIIAPYDEFLGSMAPPLRAEWATRTRAQVVAVVQPDDVLVLLAGEAYGAALSELPNLVERPLMGMRLGQRLQFLKGGK